MRGREKTGDASARMASTARPLPMLLLCLASFVYLWLYVDTSLAYYAPTWLGLPLFSTDLPFARDHWSRPGGGGEWLAAGLSQLYRLPWAGALVLEATGALVTVATLGYLQRLTGTRVALAVGLLPAALMLYLVTILGYRLTPMLATALTVAAAWLYTALSRGGDGARAGLALVLAGTCYHLTGGQVVAFACLVTIYEWAAGRRLPAMVALLSAEAVPYLVGVRLLGLDPGAAFAGLVPTGLSSMAGLQGYVVVVALYAAVPVLALLRPLLTHWGEAHAAPPEAAARRRDATARSALPWLALVGALAVGSAQHPRQVLRLEALVAAGRWDAACRVADSLPASAYLRRTGVAVLRSLYETDRLADDAFRYPMDPMLFAGITFGQPSVDLGGAADVAWLREFGSEGFFPRGDTDLMLGLVCEHEHRARDALATHGPRPEVLRGLALVHILKGRPEAARAVLRNLRHDIWHGAWARRALTEMEVDPSLATVPEVSRVRSVALREDTVTLGLSIERRLEALLEETTGNRMAFEYLVLYHLACAKPDRAVPLLRRLPELGYTRVPRAFEEAAVLVEAQTRQPVDLGGLDVGPAARDRFARFGIAYSDAMARAPDTAARALAAEFGDSYFYYAAFLHTAPTGRGRP